MKDAFKVKKGLNVQPTDPAEVVNPEAGDLIVDSTDDNRLKVYDPTSSEFAAVGTGGSSGNILSDIEKLTPTVSNVVAVTDTTTFLPIDDNNKSVKATFSGSDGTIRYEAAASADLDGVQGAAIVWIKTTLDNLTLVATKDGVAQNSGLTINSTGKWRQYEIPVVLGDANYGFEIQASGAVAGDVFIDEGVVKVQRVVQQFDTAITDWKDYTPSFQGFGSVSNIDIKYRRVGDSLEVSGDFTTGTNTAIEVQIGLPNNLSIADNHTGAQVGGWFFRDSASSTSKGSTVIYTAGDTFVNVSDLGYIGTGNVNPHTPSNGNAFSSSTRHSIKFKVPIAGWSSEKSTVVTQNTELTAKEINSCEVVFNMVTNTIITTSAGCPSGISISNNAVGINSIVIPSGFYTVLPSVTCTNSNQGALASSNCIIASGSVSFTTTNIPIASSNESGTLVDSQKINVTLTKQGADVNKSATIVGKFENINSSDLVQVVAFRGAAQSFANNVVQTAIFNQTEKDNSNGAYNTTTGIYTVPIGGSGVYNVCMTWLWDNASWNNDVVSYAHVITSDGRTINLDRFETVSTNTAYYQLKGCQKFEMNEGSNFRVDMYQASGGTRQNITSSTYNRLSITKEPDYEAIVKNLSDQKTKCQTKYLSADVSADGSTPDTDFSNLEIGKKYKLIPNLISNHANAGNDNITYVFTHDGSTVCRATTTGFDTMQPEHSPTCFFTASATTLTSAVGSITAGNNVRGDGTNGETRATLCELPDTYVETTEF